MTTQTETYRKITVQVPSSLIEEAMAMTGESLTQTITEGLRKLATSQAYRRARALKGSCPGLELDLVESRAGSD